ncbi:TSUP family transporter [Petroclostridium sp. X23]|uniref:sulfite exporter TauE/SafE family protein n=1 Tax=Petroclostridium sp. X23 TaxID=3045146 RepID=UPI0024AD36DD|nr:TSUP family transporter [Petroclostridium sp. X23]WHH59462.1 TSUP family transporter [Petroclostridium sp. X23]
MQVELSDLLIICPLVFAAGFVDSIAGGGGLISLPSYLFIGLPIHFAYGTNKFSSTFGTFFSALRFIKSKHIHMKSAIVSIISALIGSFAGAKAALALDEKYLQYCLVVLLPIIAVFILTKRRFGENNKSVHLSDHKIIVLSVLSGLIIGAYDGFFGPGTGAFLILAYTGIIGFNLTTASGNAKLVNLASNISAVITFIANGKVFFAIGIPAVFFGILGNWIGSGLAIKNGSKIIKPVFICVMILLFGKISFDLFR